MSKHRQCAWCGRLKHLDGTAHGRPFVPWVLASMGYSHGACYDCLVKLIGVRSSRHEV